MAMQAQQKIRKQALVSIMRKAALISLVVATPLLLNAQVKQLSFASDSSKTSIRWERDNYIAFKKQQGQTPATIEFVGDFSIPDSNYPKEELKITERITLSVELQKALRKNSNMNIVETNDYVFMFLYTYEGFYIGALSIWKKEQPPQRSEKDIFSSDTLK